MISLSLGIIITIISIGVILFAAVAPFGHVIFAQSSSSSTSPNSILDEYTYVCIKFNETIEERGIPVNQNPDLLNTQEICNMLLQGMGYSDKQEILKKYE
ncbi:MAG TPA: hypothetical protein VIZ62_08335 [Nitrososphaeraceae archaeon]